MPPGVGGSVAAVAVADAVEDHPRLRFEDCCTDLLSEPVSGDADGRFDRLEEVEVGVSRSQLVGDGLDEVARPRTRLRQVAEDDGLDGAEAVVRLDQRPWVRRCAAHGKGLLHRPPSLEAKVGRRASLAAGYSADDRDVAGYLQLMRETVAGNWRVRHVRSHAEKRASRAEWSLDELGNDAADGVAGRVRDELVRDLRRYEVQTAKWQRQVDARAGGEEAEVDQPDWARVETVPAWDLPTKRNWMLMHDKQVVVGPIGDWVRETLQNGYSTRYLSAQTAGLYVEKGEEKEVRAGCELELDGERWVVRLVEDGEVRCVTKATAQRAGMDDEGLDLTGTAGASDGGGSDDMRVAVRDADEELVLPLSDARVLVCTEAPMAEAESALGAPEEGARIEVYWTGMRAWYPGRVLPLQEEDEEGSMRVAYDDGAELLHPLTERWRAEGASGSEGDAEAEQGPAEAEAESNSEDDSEHYLPGPDVRLVRNVWTRGGVDARVKAVKYMWALFACNDLLFRRFGVGRSGDCEACHGRRETAWHVMGTCDDPQAARVRARWAERMWSEVRKEVVRPKQALDMGVALAVKRLWSVEGKGDYLRSWAVGSAEAVAGHGLDGQMAEMLQEVAKAGSWATWMGVFQPGWMKLLKAGGMGHNRARKLTTRLSNVITECRTELARLRNARARKSREEDRAEKERLLDERIRELHARDSGAAYALDYLLNASRAVKDGYRRRRERVERERERRQQLENEEKLRRRQRRRQRRLQRVRDQRQRQRRATGGGRARGKGKKRKGLGHDNAEAMTQLGLLSAWSGAAKAAVRVSSDTDLDSEGSEAEGASRPRMDPAIAERHDEDIRRMERQRQERAEAVGRARAAAAKRDDERRRRARRRGKRAMGWQRRQALGRMRRAKGMAASGQYGIGAEMALRRQRAINTDSDSDEEEDVVGGSLRATLGAGHAEGAGGSNLTHNSDTEESMVTVGTSG